MTADCLQFGIASVSWTWGTCPDPRSAFASNSLYFSDGGGSASSFFPSQGADGYLLPSPIPTSASFTASSATTSNVHSYLPLLELVN